MPLCSTQNRLNMLPTVHSNVSKLSSISRSTALRVLVTNTGTATMACARRFSTSTPLAAEGDDPSAAVNDAHASPPPLNPRLDSLNRAYATGRRKTSVARVWLLAGDGRIVVNGKEVHEYFGRTAYRDKLIEPFVVTESVGQFDVKCTVKGGGTTGQVGAISLGISRALEVWDPAHRPPLAKESLFTRDSRAVESKKSGQPKARKKDQWVKR